MDYKILMIQMFVRYQLLKYRPYQRLQAEDVGAHELNIEFSKEESKRSFPSRHRMFQNKYPLIEMRWERKDTYRYNHLQHNFPIDYANVVQFDDMLGQSQPDSHIRNRIFLSRARKRIRALTPADCNDMQTFQYCGQQLWNGF